MSAPRDPRVSHFHISIAKSATRILGCSAAFALTMTGDSTTAMYVLSGSLLAAEVLGIVEEI